MKALMYTVVTVFFALIGALYAGIGYGVAWILEVGLNLDVNYAVFVWAGIIVFAISVLPILFFAGVRKIIDDKLKIDFSNMG